MDRWAWSESLCENALRGGLLSVTTVIQQTIFLPLLRRVEEVHSKGPNSAGSATLQKKTLVLHYTNSTLTALCLFQLAASLFSSAAPGVLHLFSVVLPTLAASPLCTSVAVAWGKKKVQTKMHLSLRDKPYKRKSQMPEYLDIFSCKYNSV